MLETKPELRGGNETQIDTCELGCRRYFDGMLAAYGKAALWSRQTQVTDTAAAPDRPAPHAPRNTSAPAETDSAAASRRDKRRDLDEFLDNKVLRWEQALYERVKQDMDKQLAACNILR